MIKLYTNVWVCTILGLLVHVPIAMELNRVGFAVFTVSYIDLYIPYQNKPFSSLDVGVGTENRILNMCNMTTRFFRLGP